MATQAATYSILTSRSSNTARGGGHRAAPHCRNTVAAARAALAAEHRRERDELTLRLLGLVRRVALEMRDRLPAHVEVDDLISAGTLGLMEAVRRFESGKQVKIETYARYRIRGAILDALRDLDPASRDMRRKNKQAERVFHALTTRLGRPATDAEMAEAMHLTLKQWYRTVNEFRTLGVEWLRPTWMPSMRCPDEEDLPATGQHDQFELCYRQEQRAILNRVLSTVSQRDQQILSLYYESSLTMKQIADHLGVDESRVSQIHSAIVSRLRRSVQAMMRRPELESAAIAA